MYRLEIKEGKKDYLQMENFSEPSLLITIPNTATLMVENCQKKAPVPLNIKIENKWTNEKGLNAIDCEWGCGVV